MLKFIFDLECKTFDGVLHKIKKKYINILTNINNTL